MLRGIRGATTVECNEPVAIQSRVAELLCAIREANGVCEEDIGAIIFSSTPDVNAAFPAPAARQIGWCQAPLFGTQEIDNPHGLSLCVRVLILWNCEKLQREIQHVYLHDAISLKANHNGD